MAYNFVWNKLIFSNRIRTYGDPGRKRCVQNFHIDGYSVRRSYCCKEVRFSLLFVSLFTFCLSTRYPKELLPDFNCILRKMCLEEKKNYYFFKVELGHGHGSYCVCVSVWPSTRVLKKLFTHSDVLFFGGNRRILEQGAICWILRLIDPSNRLHSKVTLFVCLFVCLQGNSKGYMRISVKF